MVKLKVLCHNYRGKPDKNTGEYNPDAICNKMLGYISEESLKHNQTLGYYCNTGCKAYVEIEIKDGKPYARAILKEELDIPETLKSVILSHISRV